MFLVMEVSLPPRLGTTTTRQVRRITTVRCIAVTFTFHCSSLVLPLSPTLIDFLDVQGNDHGDGPSREGHPQFLASAKFPVILGPNGMPRSPALPKGPVILGPTGIPLYMTASHQSLPIPFPAQVLQQQEPYIPRPTTYTEAHGQANSQNFHFMMESISEPHLSE